MTAGPREEGQRREGLNTGACGASASIQPDPTESCLHGSDTSRAATQRPRIRPLPDAWPLLLALTLVASGCTPRSSDAPSASGPPGKLRVITTIYPLADWVKQIGGDEVEVTTLLKPGSSPHTYEPTPEDMIAVSRADLFLYMGLGLEEWVDKLAQAGGRKLNMHAVADETFVQQMQGSKSDLIGDNPHVWMDPKLAIPMCRHIGGLLMQARPELESVVNQAGPKYEEQLRTLATECETAFPDKQGKGVVTFHNAFTYLLRRCGLKQLGVIEEFPGKEPSAAYLEDLVKQMRGYGQRVVFAEPQLSDKAAQVIAQEIGGKVEILDDQGDPSDPARSTYEALVRYDLAHLKDGLP